MKNKTIADKENLKVVRYNNLKHTIIVNQEGSFIEFSDTFEFEKFNKEKIKYTEIKKRIAKIKENLKCN